MKYMGSKSRIAKEILPIMLYGRKPGQFWVEPFVGGGNMIDKVGGPRIGADLNKYLISFFNAVKVGYLPPKDVLEAEYNCVKDNKDLFPPYMLGYYGFALTFRSKWFGTYARNSRGDRYDHQGYNSIKKQAEKLKGVEFIHSSYIDLFIPDNSIIYCDPPYGGTHGYDGAGETFNSVEFWEWCRGKAIQGHTVYISEYNAPEDFICLWEAPLINNFNDKKAVERLFTYVPGVLNANA